MENLASNMLVVSTNHQTNKNEVTLIRKCGPIDMAEAFCKWVGKQHNGIHRMFYVLGLDIWVLNVVNDAFDKFRDERRYTDFDEVYVKGFSHVSVMTLKRTVKDTDVVVTKDEDAICYEIVFTMQTSSGDIHNFSMVFTSLDDIEFIN